LPRTREGTSTSNLMEGKERYLLSGQQQGLFEGIDVVNDI